MIDSEYSVDVSVRRVGGAYGAKITRANWIAAACGLAAHATQRSNQHSIYIHTHLTVCLLNVVPQASEDAFGY